MKARAITVLVKSPHQIEIYDGKEVHMVRVQNPIWIEPPSSSPNKGQHVALFSPFGVQTIVEHIARK